MFIDLERPAGSMFRQPVNTFLGTVFLGVCALWAGMFMWNLSTGSNPISEAIASTVQREADLLP